MLVVSFVHYTCSFSDEAVTYEWGIKLLKAQGGGGGGCSMKFYTGRLCPEVQTVTLYTNFYQNGTPFISLEHPFLIRQG